MSNDPIASTDGISAGSPSMDVYSKVISTLSLNGTVGEQEKEVVSRIVMDIMATQPIFQNNGLLDQRAMTIENHL